MTIKIRKKKPFFYRRSYKQQLGRQTPLRVALDAYVRIISERNENARRYQLLHRLSLIVTLVCYQQQNKHHNSHSGVCLNSKHA